jgi:hypothetical protein
LNTWDKGTCGAVNENTDTCFGLGECALTRPSLSLVFLKDLTADRQSDEAITPKSAV